jgi:hypothetical protein
VVLGRLPAERVVSASTQASDKPKSKRTLDRLSFIPAPSAQALPKLAPITSLFRPIFLKLEPTGTRFVFRALPISVSTQRAV